jgi:hypothetical protein
MWSIRHCPARGLHRLVERINEHAAANHDSPEGKRTHTPDALALAADKIEAKQKDRRDSNGYRSENPARHADRARRNSSVRLIP